MIKQNLCDGVDDCTIEFCFDICCPYAYIASQRVHLYNVPNVKVFWKPVLLGGIYKLTEAPQGKGGSATDIMPLCKKIILSNDLKREARRWGVELNFNSSHPIKTLDVQRFLCGLPSDQISKVALEFYKAYWVENKNISDLQVIRDIVSKFGLSDIERTMEKGKSILENNTSFIVEKGAFGVPSFFVRNGDKERLFHGQDRMHFMGLFIGLPRSHRLAHLLYLNPIRKTGRKLTLFHDFSSPWSFLGFSQIKRFCEQLGAELELRPILLGALFRDIGTPNVPMFSVSAAKREYGALDMNDWCAFYGNIQLKFPDAFPLRTVLPLRVSICEPKTAWPMYHAAWIRGLDIGNESVLEGVLNSAGFPAKKLIKESSQAKQQLIENTQLAVSLGVCGVPTFRVDESTDIVWGQDRLNVVSDMLSELTNHSNI